MIYHKQKVDVKHASARRDNLN